MADEKKSSKPETVVPGPGQFVYEKPRGEGQEKEAAKAPDLLNADEAVPPLDV